MAIKRRDFLQGMGASLVLGEAASALAACPTEAQASAPNLPASNRPPNILLIEVDQMRWDAINHRSVCNTPHINQLIKEGLNFERAYTAVALCGPSRAMMNSGAYPWHNGVYNQTHSIASCNPDMFPEVVLFSQRLKAVGYRQGFVGKWDASMPRSPLDFGYDEVADPIAFGKQTPKSISQANPDHVPQFPTSSGRDAAVSKDGRYFSWPGTLKPFLWWGHLDIPVEETWTYYTGESGIRMMKRLAAGTQPWHMQIQFHQPHDPYVPLKQYLDRYDAADIPVPASFYDTFEGKPGLHAREGQIWIGLTAEDCRQGRRHYYAYCEEVDAQIGRILRALDETGQRDNTLVVFTTDHGDMLGAHRMWGKDWMPYEDTYHIPMVMRWPGHTTPGTSTSKLVHVHDLAYTFVDAAGAGKMPFNEGRSLLPLATHPNTTDWPDHILNVWYGGEFVRGLHMVVTDRYKFIFNSFSWDELYDLKNDPNEMKNLIKDPAFAEVADDMRARMYELMQLTSDPYGDPTPFKTEYLGGNGGDRYCAPRYLPRGKRIMKT